MSREWYVVLPRGSYSSGNASLPSGQFSSTAVHPSGASSNRARFHSSPANAAASEIWLAVSGPSQGVKHNDMSSDVSLVSRLCTKPFAARGENGTMPLPAPSSNLKGRKLKLEARFQTDSSHIAFER